MKVMKTALKIALVVLIALVLIKLMPVALIPAGLAFCLLALIGLVAGSAILALCTGLVGVLLGLVCVALVVLLALSPLWIPVLACFGLIALIRRLTTKTT